MVLFNKKTQECFKRIKTGLRVSDFRPATFQRDKGKPIFIKERYIGLRAQRTAHTHTHTHRNWNSCKEQFKQV